MRFTDWIREVIRYRRESAVQGEDGALLRKRAIERGLAESRSQGVAALGEIATPDWPADVLGSSGEVSQVCAFMELLGLKRERSEGLWQLALAHLKTAAAQHRWSPGLSPHAPYTVPFELIQRLCRLSTGSGVPLAMHLAETAEEVELLAAHSGHLVELLCELDAWDAGAVPRGTRPLDYLRELATSARALVIHGNYLTEPELAFLGQHRDCMSLVYCPRTHAYFGHGRYPLLRALELGVNVSLGTDSRASNPDLSLLREMRHVCRAFPEIAPSQVLRMGTLGGATALALDAEFGSLEPGKRAVFCLVPLADHSPIDPHELLLNSDQDPMAWCLSYPEPTATAGRS
jgi:cytosine/adenosine deaminase-related metal-dependent hydrolase